MPQPVTYQKTHIDYACTLHPLKGEQAAIYEHYRSLPDDVRLELDGIVMALTPVAGSIGNALELVYRIGRLMRKAKVRVVRL